MSRAWTMAALALILTAGSGALAVMCGWSSVPVVPGVLLVAYAALVDPPVEAAITAALVGLVLDALVGTPFGVNVLACVSVLVGSRLFLPFVTSARGLPSALFAGGFSAAQALVALLALFLFQKRESFGFVSLFATALGNGVASVVLFPLLRRVLVMLRLEEKGETLQQRLQANQLSSSLSASREGRMVGS